MNVGAAEQCIALTDFTAELPDELSFKKGDVITVTAKGSASGFWEGCIGQEPNVRCGTFPNCLVSSNMTPDKPPIFLNKCIALFDYAPRDGLEMRLTKGDLVTVLAPHETSPGWWKGMNETQLRYGKDPRLCGSEMAPLIFPSNFVTANIVQAAFSFQGRHQHELTFIIGDVIQVHRRWNDGWWEGTLQGKRGIFPSNYAIPNVPTTTPPLFCLRCKTVFLPSSTSCKECAKNEEITKTMMRSLEDYMKGFSDKLDLFQHIEIDPRTGRGALLSKTDVDVAENLHSIP